MSTIVSLHGCRWPRRRTVGVVTRPAFGIVPYTLGNTDGDELWYVTISPGQDPTLLVSANGSELRANAVQSPDATRIVFTGSGLEIIGVDGSGRSTLIPLDAFFRTFAFWRPDGDHLLFVLNDGQSNARGDIYRVDPDGGNVSLVAAALSGTDAGWSRPQYNRDGTLIAAVHQALSNTGDLYVMDADGTNQVLVAEDIAYFAHGSQWGWANTMDVLAYADRTNGGIWRVDADGTNQSRISTSTSTGVLCSRRCWVEDDSVVIAAVATLPVASVPADGSGESALIASAPTNSQTAPLIFGDRVYYITGSVGSQKLISVALDGSNQRNEHVLTGDQSFSSQQGLEWS